MEASMLQEEGRSGAEQEEKKKLKKKKKCRKDELDLAGMHPPSLSLPWEAATVQETGLLGPKVTCSLSPSLIFIPVSTSWSVPALPLTSLPRTPCVKHS